MQKDILLLYANTLSSYIILAKLALPSNRSPMHLNAWKKLQQLKKKTPRIQNREHSAGKNAFLWQKLKAQNIKEASAARTKKFRPCCYISEILPDWSSSSRGTSAWRKYVVGNWINYPLTERPNRCGSVYSRSSRACWSFEIGKNVVLEQIDLSRRSYEIALDLLTPEDSLCTTIQGCFPVIFRSF